MKTVSGVVISSKPVSLSKAAKIISKFSATDNGSTPAYAHYLNRTSESFAELVQLHKELSGAGSKSTSKGKRHWSEITQSEAEELVSSGQNHVKDDEVEEKYVEIPNEIKEPKKKKRNNTVDTGVEQRIHEKLDTVEDGRKKEKEAKKARKHVIKEGGSNGVVDGAPIQNDAKNVVDEGVEQRINGELDSVKDGMGVKKREKEAKKVKNHIGIDNDAKNVVDNGVDQRTHGKLDSADNSLGGKKRDKEAKKVKNHAGIDNDAKNVIDNGVEQRTHGKLDSADNSLGGKKREKETKKVKNHGVLNGVGIENDSENVVDNSGEQRIHGKLDSVDNSIGGKKREKEAKKARNQVTEDGGSNGVSNEVRIENGKSKKRKTKDVISVVENREEENKMSKKRKSEEMAEAVNGDVNGSAEKLMKHKKRKKSN